MFIFQSLLSTQLIRLQRKTQSTLKHPMMLSEASCHRSMMASETSMDQRFTSLIPTTLLLSSMTSVTTVSTSTRMPIGMHMSSRLTTQLMKVNTSCHTMTMRSITTFTSFTIMRDIHHLMLESMVFMVRTTTMSTKNISMDSLLKNMKHINKLTSTTSLKKGKDYTGSILNTTILKKAKLEIFFKVLQQVLSSTMAIKCITA